MPAPAEENRIPSETNKDERFPKGSFVFWFLMVLAAVAADQVTKRLAFGTDWLGALGSGTSLVHKQLFLNDRFAFSLPLPAAVMLVVYAVAAALIARHVVRKFREFSKLEAAAWALITGGAISNIAERLVLGHVRDFLYVASGIFNLADGFILIGVAVLLVQYAARGSTQPYDR